MKPARRKTKNRGNLTTLTKPLPDVTGVTDNQNTKLIFNIIFAAMVAAALALYGTSFADSNDFRWLWIMGLAGLSLLQMSSRAFLRGNISFDWPELLLLGFVAYAVLSLAWSPDFLAGLALLSKLGLLAAIFLCLKNAGNDAWFNWLCGAIAAAVVIVLGFELLKVTGPIAWGGYGNENFLTEFLILAVPFIAALAFIYRHKAVRAAVLAVLIADLGYLFFFNPSKIEFLVIAGLATAAIIGWGWRRSRRLTVTGVLAMVAVVVASVSYYWGADNGFRVSIYPRLALIINSLLMWLSQPIFGLGAGSYNYTYFLFQERHLEWLDLGTELFASKETTAGAAHNEYVQLLATFGLLGAGLVAGFAYSLLRGLKGRPMTVYAWCGLAASGVWLLNALVEFPLQNPATALLAVIGLGFLARHGQPNKADGSGAVFAINLNRARRMLLLFGAVVLVGAVGYGGYRFSSAHRHYLETVRYLNTRPDYAYAQNFEAYRLYPWDTAIRTQMYVTTTRWYELTRKTPLPLAEMDRVFEIAMSAGPNTLLLLARLQFLLNSNLFQQEPRYAQEVEQWFGLLRKGASRTADVLILDGYYQILLKNHVGAEALLNEAEKLKLNTIQQQLLVKLRMWLTDD